MINTEALKEKIKQNKNKKIERDLEHKQLILKTLEENEDKIQEMFLRLCGNNTIVNKTQIAYNDFWKEILTDVKYTYNVEYIIIKFFKKRKIHLNIKEINDTNVMYFEW